MSAKHKPFRVLFICMGNICRSPAADIIFHHMVEDAGLDGRIMIDSAGTIGYHTGNPPDPRMAEELESRGYRITGRARQVRRADLDDFDLLLPMDEDNLAEIEHLDRGGIRQDKIRLFTSFCTEHTVREVPDPYYGGRKGFAEVADILEDGCRALLEELRGKLA